MKASLQPLSPGGINATARKGRVVWIDMALMRARPLRIAPFSTPLVAVVINRGLTSSSGLGSFAPEGFSGLGADRLPRSQRFHGSVRALGAAMGQSVGRTRRTAEFSGANAKLQAQQPATSISAL